MGVSLSVLLPVLSIIGTRGCNLTKSRAEVPPECAIELERINGVPPQPGEQKVLSALELEGTGCPWMRPVAIVEDAAGDSSSVPLDVQWSGRSWRAYLVLPLGSRPAARFWLEVRKADDGSRSHSRVRLHALRPELELRGAMRPRQTVELSGTVRAAPPGVKVCLTRRDEYGRPQHVVEADVRSDGTFGVLLPVRDAYATPAPRAHFEASVVTRCEEDVAKALDGAIVRRQQSVSVPAPRVEITDSAIVRREPELGRATVRVIGTTQGLLPNERLWVLCRSGSDARSIEVEHAGRDGGWLIETDLPSGRYSLHAMLGSVSPVMVDDSVRDSFDLVVPR